MRTDTDPLDAEERYMIDAIRALQCEYEKAIKPYADRLVYLRSLRPHPPFVIMLDAALAAGIEMVPRA